MACVMGLLSASLGAWAADARVIVAFKPDAAALRLQALASAGSTSALQRRADALAGRAGVPLVTGMAVADRWQVMRAKGLDSATLAARLAQHPDVEWAVVDHRRRAMLVPNDPLYGAAVRAAGPDAGQWYLRPPDATLRSATNAESAWDRITGQASVVVAVLDTGVLATHPDLIGRVLPGIDTIVDTDISNDGDGEDTNATDPGDWISAAENASGPLEGCGEASSSWHGTMVASIIGATANDGIGMAGTAHGVSILPVRVLGKCGGYDSNIINGMLWAAGLQRVAGVLNPNPARVLNMSLGSAGSCELSYANAVRRINAAGVVIVAAAGNSVGQAVGTPANCPGVIGVAGLRHAGTKVGFSDLGPEITIAAPGGNCVNIDGVKPCLYPILAATNSGLLAPNAGGSIWTDSFNISVGTSFATPIVAGAAALMLSARPSLQPAEVTAALRASARPFPTTGADNGVDDPTPVPACVAPSSAEQLQCYCTTGLCGAGMLDMAAAVDAVLGVVPRIGLAPVAPVAGALLTLDGSASQVPAGRAITAYDWQLVDAGGVVSGFSSASNAVSATLVPDAAGTFVVRLTLTDDLGAKRSADLAVVVAAAPEPGGNVPTPPAGPAAGTGGGATGWLWWSALALAVIGLRRRPAGPQPQD